MMYLDSFWGLASRVLVPPVVVQSGLGRRVKRKRVARTSLSHRSKTASSIGYAHMRKGVRRCDVQVSFATVWAKGSVDSPMLMP